MVNYHWCIVSHWLSGESFQKFFLYEGSNGRIKLHVHVSSFQYNLYIFVYNYTNLISKWKVDNASELLEQIVEVIC